MKIFVGSSNPVKVQAVVVAISHQWPDAEVKGFEVPSGVPAQPLTDDQTRLGATNRARLALEAGKLHAGASADQDISVGVGLEGGVFEQPNSELWSTVWVVVVDTKGNQVANNGARFKVPERIAQAIRTGGEMGPVVQQLTGQADVKQKQGMIGIITQGMVDRTEEYTGIAKLALGLWHGRNWDRAYGSDS